MSDDLQTLTTAALRQQHAAAVAARAAGGDASPNAVGVGASASAAGGGASSNARAASLIDSRQVDTFLESLKAQDNPGLQCESVHALAVVVDRLTQAVQLDGIPVLLELLRSDDEHAKAKAGEAVREIVNSDSEIRRNLILGPVVRGIMGDDPAERRKRTSDLTWILCMENPPIQKVLETGIAPTLNEFLKRDEDPNLQFVAACAVANIASGATEQIEVLDDAGAISSLVRLLRSPDKRAAGHAVRGLMNVARCSSKHRVSILENGAVQPLLELAVLPQDANLDAVSYDTRALANLCAGESRPSFELLRPALPVLRQLITRQNDSIVADACRALANLAYSKEEAIQEIVDVGVCPQMVELLSHSNPTVQVNALRAIGNICSGSIQQSQVIFDLEPLPTLHGLLESPIFRIQELACLTIANIVWDGQECVQAIIDCGIVPLLLKHLGSSKFEMRKQAARALRNFTLKGTLDQIQVMVDAGCIPRLCGVLTVDAPESPVVSYALRALQNILRAGLKLAQGGGADALSPDGLTNPMALLFKAKGRSKLQELQRHPDDAIRNKSVDLLKRYFGIGEDDEGEEAVAEAEERVNGDV